LKLFLVTSDSHGDLRALKKAVDEYPMIQTIIHLGDYYKDALYLKSIYSEKEIHIVPGNCDMVQSADEILIEEEGMLIWAIHGHRYQVKSGLDRLKARVHAKGYSVALFGHTHTPHIERCSGSLLINPGSIGYPRHEGPGTYALLEIGNGRCEARIMEVL
jgi:putative phosphoesterase